MIPQVTTSVQHQGVLIKAGDWVRLNDGTRAVFVGRFPDGLFSFSVPTPEPLPWKTIFRTADEIEGKD
jgi:hypothetical protein